MPRSGPPPIPRSHRTASQKRGPKNPTKPQIPIVAIAACAGVTFALIVGLIAAMTLRGPSSPHQPVASGTPVAGSPAFSMGSGTSAWDRRQQFEQYLRNAKDSHGATGYAIVTVQSAPEPVAEAEFYLKSRLNRAHSNLSRPKTPDSSPIEMMPAIPFSASGYFSVNGGHYSGSTHTYYVGPVPDLKAFADQLTFGDRVSINPRTFNITIKSWLPTPCPDPYEEEYALTLGPGKIIRIELTYDPPADGARVQTFLQRKRPFSSRKYGWFMTNGPYPHTTRVYLQADDPLQSIVDQFDFGMVTSTDVAARRISGRISSAELSQEPSEETDFRPDLDNTKPAAGEDTVDWALRVLRKKGSWHSREALSSLARTPAKPERLTEVVNAIVAFALTDDGHKTRSEIIDAGNQWQGPALAKIAIAKLDDRWWDKKRLVEWLVKYPSPEGADAVARFLNDSWHNQMASEALPKMGLAAEATVLRLLQNAQIEDRPRYVQYLKTVGGSRAIEVLERYRQEETRKTLIAMYDRTIANIRDRIDNTAASPPSSESEPAAESSTTDRQPSEIKTPP